MREQAHLVLVDESGLQLGPLVRRTLAPRGKTPILKQRGSHRDRVSVISALSRSPQKQHLNLYFQTFPKSYVNNVRAAAFLRDLLRHLRGKVIVLWDNGPMHKGAPLRDLLRRFPRLSIERLPPYAPELNPVESLWNHLKYGQLANYTPHTIPELDRRVKSHLRRIRHSQKRLQSFVKASHLPRTKAKKFT